MSVFFYGCQFNKCEIEPCISYAPQPRLVERLPSPFKPLSKQERAQEWGRELFIGRQFAKEMDLYRALTCFKRALFLIPKNIEDRRMQIEYEIFLAYYMGCKYEEAIEAFENSHLINACEDFPPFRDMLIAVYDAYIQCDKLERACHILGILSAIEQETAQSLALETAIVDADFCTIARTAENHPAADSVYQFLCDYEWQSKSVKKAQTLNALLPGAGYYYVGQKKTALTSFIINALFIAASYQLFDRGYIAAGLITTSLEIGWYFGGINGAGLAAKEFNERLYKTHGREVLMQNRLFPMLMIQTGF